METLTYIIAIIIYFFISALITAGTISLIIFGVVNIINAFPDTTIPESLLGFLI